MSESFDQIAAQWGIDVPTITAPEIKNTGASFHKHSAGVYDIIVLDFVEKWQDPEKKQVEPNTPGAKPYGIFRFLLIKDSEGKQLLKEDFSINPDVSYGELVFNQYITYESDRQYTNKALFGNFFIEGIPELAIVQEDGANYNIRLANLVFFYGAPAKMELVDEYKGKKTNPFIKNLTLNSHKLSKEVLQKRKVVADKLVTQLNAKRKQEEDERKAQKEENSSTASQVAPPPPDSAEADSILSNYDV